jgi:hypothetical protein
MWICINGDEVSRSAATFLVTLREAWTSGETLTHTHSHTHSHTHTHTHTLTHTHTHTHSHSHTHTRTQSGLSAYCSDFNHKVPPFRRYVLCVVLKVPTDNAAIFVTKMSQNSVLFPWQLLQLSYLAGLLDAVNGVHFITLGFGKTNMKPLSSLCFSDISYRKQKSWSSLK